MNELREKLDSSWVIANQGEYLIIHLQLTNTIEDMKKLHDLLQE